MQRVVSTLRVLGSIAASVVLCLTIEARGVDLSPEQQTGALLLKITRYVTWPDPKKADSNSFFLVGVLGTSAVVNVLQHASKGRSVHGRPYRVVHFPAGWDVREWRKCQVLFISQSEQGRLAEILSAIEGASVLSVSSIESFANRGGMLSFDTSSTKLRILLNPRIASEVGIEFSSRLQKIATIVDR